MRLATTLLAGLFAGSVIAKLPPPSDDVKAKAAEAAAKTAWSDKVGLFQLCRAQDRTVEAYRKSAKAAGKVTTSASMTTATCADPGPYASPVTPPGSKPLEAAGAHSPPGLAISPPNTKTPAAEIPAGAKK